MNDMGLIAQKLCSSIVIFSCDIRDIERAPIVLGLWPVKIFVSGLERRIGIERPVCAPGNTVDDKGFGWKWGDDQCGGTTADSNHSQNGRG